MAFLPKVLRVA